MTMTHEEVKDVERRTRGQNSNSLWHELRLGCLGRLTVSKFGIVLKACRRNSFPAGLFKSLFEQYNVSGVKAVTWGMENEQKAVDDYIASYGLLEEVGLCLHPSGTVAATPDRLEGSDGIVEIKCPYAYKNATIHDYLEDSKCCVGLNESCEFRLDEVTCTFLFGCHLGRQEFVWKRTKSGRLRTVHCYSISTSTGCCQSMAEA